MNRATYMSIFLAGALLAAVSNVRADFATPFVEINNKVGDVSESFGYVVNLGPDKGDHFLVIVLDDTGHHHVLHATAGPGAVDQSLIGREVIVKAEVIDSVKNTLIPLKILKLRPMNSGPIEKFPPTSAPATPAN